MLGGEGGIWQIGKTRRRSLIPGARLFAALQKGWFGDKCVLYEFDLVTDWKMLLFFVFQFLYFLKMIEICPLVRVSFERRGMKRIPFVILDVWPV